MWTWLRTANIDGGVMSSNVHISQALSTSLYVTLYISVRHALYLSAARFVSQYDTLYISVRHALYLSAARYLSQYVVLRISARPTCLCYQ
jgi:hypothetical protein